MKFFLFQIFDRCPVCFTYKTKHFLPQIYLAPYIGSEGDENMEIGEGTGVRSDDSPILTEYRIAANARETGESSRREVGNVTEELRLLRIGFSVYRKVWIEVNKDEREQQQQQQEVEMQTDEEQEVKGKFEIIFYHHHYHFFFMHIFCSFRFNMIAMINFLIGKF